MEIRLIAEGDWKATLRKQWDKAVRNELEEPDGYTRVAVLIIRWDDSLDTDLKTKGEAEALEGVFHNDFHFETKTVLLNVNKRPQVLLNSALENFVADYDGHPGSHLLIVYYTGHGFVRHSSGHEHLCISGLSGPRNVCEPSYLPEAKWDQAEVALNDAEADVLTILDCCYAGTTTKYPNEHSLKSHELLVACGKYDQTQEPGQLSYTRALISSLNEVLQREDKNVSTFDLHQMILDRRKSWNATSNLCNRSQTFARHICLAPLPRSSEPKVEAPAGHLELRVSFQRRICPTGEEIEQLATDLSRAAKSTKMDISAIELIGFKRDENEALGDASSKARSESSSEG